MKKKIVLAILLHSLLSKKKEEKEEEEEEEEEGSFDREEMHRRIDPRLSHFCNLNLPLISFPSIISPSSFLPSLLDELSPYSKWNFPLEARRTTHGQKIRKKIQGIFHVWKAWKGEGVRRRVVAWPLPISTRFPSPGLSFHNPSDSWPNLAAQLLSSLRVE